MATAKRRAIDHLRRDKLLERKHEELGRELEVEQETAEPDLDAALDDHVGDDLLRLMFIALPPGALDRGARRAHAAAARRADHRGDRARVPRPRGDASRSGSSAPSGRSPRRACPFEVPARRRARRAARLGARGDLPHLQRGLLGHGRRRLDAARALRGRAPPRPHPRRARAGRAGGARPRRADGDPGVAARARASARPASRSCCSTRTARRWDRLLIRRGLAALERAEAARRRARAVRAPGRDRRLPRARAHRRGDGLGAHRRALRRARRSSRRRRSSS